MMPLVESFTEETTSYVNEGWTIRVADELRSTNSIAGRLPPWTAVRARVQTDGRGRTGRYWVSDEGGLWLSAVVPCPGERAKWSILPLAAGWAFITALEKLGVKNLRLRWPNDIMVGRRKLAGLLVERYTEQTAVVGIGVNVFNDPERGEPELSGATARLADLLEGNYTLDDITQVLLRSLRAAHATLLEKGFAVIADELNRRWGKPRLVCVTLTGRDETFSGQFHGIDCHGRLQLATPREGFQLYDPTQIELLRELE